MPALNPATDTFDKMEVVDEFNWYQSDTPSWFPSNSNLNHALPCRGFHRDGFSEASDGIDDIFEECDACSSYAWREIVGRELLPVENGCYFGFGPQYRDSDDRPLLRMAVDTPQDDVGSVPDRTLAAEIIRNLAYADGPDGLEEKLAAAVNLRVGLLDEMLATSADRLRQALSRKGLGEET